MGNQTSRYSTGDGKVQCPFSWLEQGGRDADDGTYLVHGIRDRIS